MTDTTYGADVAAADTAPLHLPHAAVECPKCFTELQRDRDWWLARPAGSRLVGVVVSRDDMPSVVQQRDDLTRFGVPIEGFRHPAPEILESWEQRLARLFDTFKPGDVLVVTNVQALGRNVDEGTRTITALTRRGVVVKVLSHGARHLDAAPTA
ncbi:recombinase family protein [Microbacterium marinilacus]|uniref:Resolvase/invertase-type recombinase catalytic domain-containing protein n=1 Tax=Microbacterium marinilacus TaxID=415209 RepID=A0ABP7BHM7_9MICO|nr:recombinase family protein [Microbacterium marinilacus]MBY0689500.1 recombinase family protein [Microbacterium marinilacus]